MGVEHFVSKWHFSIFFSPHFIWLGILALICGFDFMGAEWVEFVKLLAFLFHDIWLL